MERIGKTPWQIIVAEIFLIFILMNYFAKICVLAMGMIQEEDDKLLSKNLLLFFVEIAMLFISINATMNITSRKPAGWKKTVRCCMLLFLFTMIGWFTLHFHTSSSVATLVTFSPELIAAMVAIVYLLMLHPKVRKYYLPPMEKDKPIKDWIKYSFFSELYHTGRYRVKYGDE